MLYFISNREIGDIFYIRPFISLITNLVFKIVNKYSKERNFFDRTARQLSNVHSDRSIIRKISSIDTEYYIIHDRTDGEEFPILILLFTTSSFARYVIYNDDPTLKRIHT